MGDLLGDRTISVLSKTLDGMQLRQKVIANNIANVDTPGYKRKDVDFKSQLKSALDEKDLKLNKTNTKHLSTNANLNQISSKIKVENNTSMRKDKNNVDIDYEMTALAKNQLEYQATTKLLSTKFKKLNSVINKAK